MMRILVAYETAHGSTRETAEAIAEVLRERGAEVDVVRCRDVESVEGYDVFVVGAPVWAGNWLKPARRFVARHEDALASHPTAYFHCSAAAGGDESREEVAEQMAPRLRRYANSVEPVSVGNLAGVVDYSRYNLAVRLIMQAIMGRQRQPTEGRHDYRDWERIRGWAASVYDTFAERLNSADTGP
ncbi:MAG: flavodoxin domain-containing protein [Armatimonadota bacterium]